MIPKLLTNAIFCCGVFSVVCFQLALTLFTALRHMLFCGCAFPEMPDTESRPLLSLETAA